MIPAPPVTSILMRFPHQTVGLAIGSETRGVVPTERQVHAYARWQGRVGTRGIHASCVGPTRPFTPERDKDYSEPEPRQPRLPCRVSAARMSFCSRSFW